MSDTWDETMKKANAAANEVVVTVFDNGTNLIKKFLRLQGSAPEIEIEIQDMIKLYDFLEKNNYKDIDGLKKTIKGLMKQISSNEDVKDYINGNMLKKFESRGN